MITSPISMIIIGKDQQERSTARLQLLSSGKVHVVAESSDYNRGLELVRQFNPHSALVIINGTGEEPLGLVKGVAEAYPSTAVVCTGSNVPPNVIVRAYRSGATEFLVQPLKLEELEEALNKIDAMRSASTSGARHGHIVAVYSGRGGSGTTTLAVNLAAGIVKWFSQETVLIDLNLQYGTMPLFFGVDPEYTIADVVRNQERLDAQLLKSFLMRMTDDLYCLPSPLKVEEADDVQPNHVQRLLSMLRTQFSYIIVDCQHQLDIITVTALDMADTILLVSLLDVPSVYSAKRVLEIFHKMEYPPEKIKAVINRFDRAAGIPIEKVEQVFDAHIEAIFADDPRSATSAINLGNPLVLSQPKSALIKQYDKLARTITGSMDEADQRKPGLFDALLGKK
jgi:pilus assembly protein CpaE